MSSLFSEEAVDKANQINEITRSNRDTARVKYELIVDLLSEVQDELKSLGSDYYWPSRIGEGLHYVLKDATEALEELK